MNIVSDEAFNELKEKAIEIWKTYDNQFGYVDEKLAMIEPIQNVQDNFGTFIGMFDIHNQRKLYNAVELKESKEAIDYWVGGSLEQAEHNAAQLGLF